MSASRLLTRFLVLSLGTVSSLEVRNGSASASLLKNAPTTHGQLPEGNSSSTMRPNAQQAVHSSGVVHLLFLASSKILHLDIWKTWISQAPPGSYTAHVHCKDPVLCGQNGVMDFPGMNMVPTTPTWYCHDLVTAMAQLLRYSLDASNSTTGTPVREKFVIISDSTLPVKPYHELHAALVADDDSDFCVFPKWQWGWTSIDGKYVELVKHHQWMTLNRAHAQMFVDAWVPVDARGVWQIWLRGGHWQGKERFVSPQHFNIPRNSNRCADEWAFIATIFGAMEPGDGVRQLPDFGGGPLHTIGPLTEASQGRCRTFTYWDNRQGPAFSNVGAAIHTDWAGSYMSCYPTCNGAHPAEFSQLSWQSLRVLRNSEFLFVRKFTEFATLPEWNLA